MRRRLDSSAAGTSAKKTRIVAVGSSVIQSVEDETDVLREEILVIVMVIAAAVNVAIRQVSLMVINQSSGTNSC